MAVGIAGWLPVTNFLSLFVRDELGGSITGAALLLLAIHSGTATLGLTSGFWMRRIGSRWTYALGLVGMMAFTLLLVLTTDLITVVAAAPFIGFALALHWAGSQTYVLEAAPTARRGLATGILSFVIIAAPGLVGIWFGEIAENAGYRVLAGVASGMIGAAVLIVAIFMPSTLNQPGNRSRPDGDVLRVLRETPLVAMVAARAGTTVSFGAVVLLGGPKLIEAGGDLRSVGLFTLVGAIGGAVAQIGIGRLSDAIGRRGVFALSIVVGAGASIGFGVADEMVPLLIFSGLLFLAFSTHQTLMPAIAGDIAQPGQIPAAIALQTSAFSLGVIFGAGATAILATTAAETAFYVGATGMAVALLAVPWLRCGPTGA